MLNKIKQYIEDTLDGIDADIGNSDIDQHILNHRLMDLEYLISLLSEDLPSLLEQYEEQLADTSARIFEHLDFED